MFRQNQMYLIEKTIERALIDRRKEDRKTIRALRKLLGDYKTMAPAALRQFDETAKKSSQSQGCI